MIPTGLSADDQRALRTAMVTSNRVRVRARVETLTGSVISDLSPYITDGQVNVDSSATVTRSLTLVLNDPRRVLPFDSDHPADTALYFDRRIRVLYDVLVNGSYVTLPVFTGPVTKLDRDGDQVTVECQGKEALFLGAAWQPLTLHKGMKKTDAIRRLLTEGNPVYAETALDIPDLSARLPKTISLARQDIPWRFARSIGLSMSMQLFYDGRGTGRLRHLPAKVGFSFTGAAHVVSPIQVSFSDTFVNAVIVVGAIPKNAKHHVGATAVAPASHPLAPARVGRYLMPGGAIITDDAIKTTAEAVTRANQELADGLRQGVDVSFDSVPGPGALLDPWDLCHVSTDDGSVEFRLNRFSVPLVVGDAAVMTVGYHKSVTLRKIVSRRRRTTTTRKR